MYKYYDNKLQRNTVNLAPGEFFASSEDLVINTVLGSCVAVVLHDPVVGISGMNHFMLAESKLKIKSDKPFQVERYGLYAMDALLSLLIKNGAQKNRIQAKIFGGSSVLEVTNNMDIGADNIIFAEKFLEAEKIPVINRDTGGKLARRIYLYTRTFRVLLRRVQRSTEFESQMAAYRERLEKAAGKGSETVLF